MKISLITLSYNSARTIADTIESVIAQTQSYPAQDLEYIMVDGASSDKTKEIILNYKAKYKDKIDIKFISEPDKGLYYAMNKGIKMATGDIVGILNSDDFYYSKDILSKVNNLFEKNPDIDGVYGDLIYVRTDNIKKETRYWKAGEYKEEKLNWGWSIPHPTFFVRRRVYDGLDKLFDTTLSIAADYELTFRLLKINKIKVKYLPETLVIMREGGTSAKNIINRIKGWREQRQVWKINSLKTPPFFLTKRVLSKVGQFLHILR